MLGSKTVAVIRTPNISSKTPRIPPSLSAFDQLDDTSFNRQHNLESHLRLRQQAISSSSSSVSPLSSSSSSSSSSSARSMGQEEGDESKLLARIRQKKRTGASETDEEGLPISNHNSTPLYLRRRHATVCVTSDLRSQPSLLSPTSSTVKISLPDTRPSSTGLLVVKPSSSSSASTPPALSPSSSPPSASSAASSCSARKISDDEFDDEDDDEDDEEDDGEEEEDVETDHSRQNAEDLDASHSSSSSSSSSSDKTQP